MADWLSFLHKINVAKTIVTGIFSGRIEVTFPKTLNSLI